MWKASTAALLLLMACAPRVTPSSGATNARELEVVRGSMAIHERELAAIEQRSSKLSAAWRDVELASAAAADDYADAQRAYDEARANAQAAGDTFKRATLQWQEAKRRWELYERLVLVAAYIDASNLTAARAAGSALSSFSCESVSTAAFRRMLEVQHVPLGGMDIDHIVPRSLGGADHPSNYQVLSSSLNRSLGASWGVDKCRMAGAQCADAVAVSRTCGSYQGMFP